MNIISLDIIGQIERLAEACPWDSVDLWTCRTPEGKYTFTAYVAENSKFGFKSVFGHGETPEEAVSQAVKQTGARDPDIGRKAKIEELRHAIEKLQAVVIGLPPYRPNRELTNGERSIKARETVDV